MKKDTVYSIRMSKQIKDLLKMAARRDRRTTASLMEKIICDYLEQEGLLTKPAFNTEKRQHYRKGVMLPVKTMCKEAGETHVCSGVVANLCQGGAMVLFPTGFGLPFETAEEYPGFELCVESAETGEEVFFNCETRHRAVFDDQIQLGAAFVKPKEKNVATLNRLLN